MYIVQVFGHANVLLVYVYIYTVYIYVVCLYRWLLVPGESGFSLVGDPNPPTFYQTLGEQHGCM